jgi:hypothetical protein
MTTSWLEGPATVAAESTYFRVARSDQPLAFSSIGPTDAQFAFAGNRFDVVGGGVLCLGTTAGGCYAETVARFRPSAKVRAAVGDEPGFVICGGIPADWRARRLEVQVDLPDALPFVDVESPQTHAYLTAVMAPVLAGLAVDALDVGLVRGRNRLITRAIAAWAYAAADPDGAPLYSGLRYLSRLGEEECWAVFDGTDVQERARSPIERTNPDLDAVAQTFGLTVF